MLFNRKLSKCISVVLASSALCSNSLVIAINRTTKIFVPALMFKSKDNIAGYFPDDINNKELLRYVYGVLMDGDKCVGLYIDGKILADDKIIPIYSKDKKYIGDYVNFEIWFREMICQILASLDRERLLKVCKLISFEGESGHLEFVTFGVVELVGFPKPEYLVSDTDVCAEDFISDISIFFDEFKKYLKNDKSNINFWGIMANFFKDFLVDLSNQSFDFDNKKFKYFDKIYYFHYFILVINMLKLYKKEIIFFYIISAAALITAYFVDLKLDIFLNNPKDPSQLFDRKKAERFKASGRIIMAPGDTITLEPLA